MLRAWPTDPTFHACFPAPVPAWDRNGSLSAFDIKVAGNIRILAVDGQGIKRWEVIRDDASSTDTVRPSPPLSSLSART